MRAVDDKKLYINASVYCIPINRVRSKHALICFYGLQIASIVLYRFMPIRSTVLVALDL